MSHTRPEPAVDGPGHLSLSEALYPNMPASGSLECAGRYFRGEFPAADELAEDERCSVEGVVAAAWSSLPYSVCLPVQDRLQVLAA